MELRLKGADRDLPPCRGRKGSIRQHQGVVTSLDALTGSPVWKYKANESVYSSPAAFSGKIFFGTNSDVLVCLDGKTGSVVWRAPFNADVLTSPAIAGDRIVVAGADGKVCTLQ